MLRPGLMTFLVHSSILPCAGTGKSTQGFQQCGANFPGAVHSLRSTRRLWSPDLLQPLVGRAHAEGAEAFQKVFHAFAQLRDTQVLLQAIKKDVRDPAEWRAFSGMLCRRKTKLIRRAEKCLKKAKLNELKDSLEAVREALPRDSSGKSASKRNYKRIIGIVDRAFGTARKRQRAIDPEDPTSIHLMRIAFKKFRYVFEAVQEILPELTPGHTKAMQSYQTLMGRVQDADVLLTTVQKFHSKRKTDSTTALAQRNELLQLRSRRIAEFVQQDAWLLHREKYGLATAILTRRHRS
jgi:CHAD domain-containing protein